jgi:hypothetical protein
MALACLGRRWAADTRCRSGNRGQQRTVAPQVTTNGFGSRSWPVLCLEEDEELLYDQVRLRRNAVTRLALQRCDLVAVTRADPVGLHAFIRGYQDWT